MGTEDPALPEPGEVAGAFGRLTIINAKDLLAKWREAYPGRFEDAQLGTLQRRVKGWRGVMARGLHYAASDEPASEPSGKVELEPILKMGETRMSSEWGRWQRSD